MAAESSGPGIMLPARFIPTPTSISPQAQAFLSQGLGVDPPKIAVEDRQGWRDYIAMVDRYLEANGAARVAAYPADIREHPLTNCTLYEVTPATLDEAADGDKAILHVHGGAFIIGGGISAAHTAQPVASAARLRSFSVDYRMPPDHPFPVGLHDCLEAYRILLERYAPEKIAIEGGSAGANLAAAVVLLARDERLPLPGALVLHTAAVDMTHSGDSFETNQILDVVLRSGGNNAIPLYCNGHDLRDPHLSPLFGDFTKGFPPTQLLTGTRDMLLSPTVMMHRALRRAGIDAELHVFEAMPHGSFGQDAPEDHERLGETARFIRERICGD